MHSRKFIIHSAIFAALLSSSGCANLGGHEDIEEAIARAQTTADEALRQAKAANMKADEALQLIRGTNTDPSSSGTSTRAIATQALKEAKEAKAAAGKANKRAERMFQKALSK